MSWASSSGTIQVSQGHINAGPAIVRAVLAHEFGHLIAFRYGSQAFTGAAPQGWPSYSSRPEEAWADCVAQAFTGVVHPSHGLPACGGGSRSFTGHWHDQAPAPPPRTSALPRARAGEGEAGAADRGGGAG